MTALDSTRRAAARFRRAVRLRCPQCGGTGIFSGWFRMRSHCPVCGMRLERGEQGYVVGAYMFNIVASELVWAAVFVGILVATWPSPPWTLFEVGGGILMLVLPFLFYPFSKSLFLAFDLLFNPVRPEDHSEPPAR